MGSKKKLKIKEKPLMILKVFGIIVIVFLLIFLFYRKNINDIKKLGYSEKASQNILFKLKKDYVIKIGKNETVNAAFESDDYNEDYLDNYRKIDYQKQKNIIKNINKLIKVGYSDDDISMILAHGDDSDVSEFAKRKKVRYLEEFYSINYAKLKYYDRYIAYMDESREDEETSVLHVNLNMDKEDYAEPIIVNDFSFTMLVNKHRMLKKDFIPDDLITIDSDYASEKGYKGNRTALLALKEMFDQAEKEGFHLIVNSAYRSYEDQNEIMETYRGLYGDNYVTNYVIKPGYSEHQTGLSFDIGSRDTNVFKNSDEYIWIQDNCYKYGYIYRFKKSYEEITGIKNEAWHYRYVGKKLAKYIYENDITLEEYYAMFLDK